MKNNKWFENKSSRKIGILGENIACSFLADKGFLILKRNQRQNPGEIDIIGKSKDRVLVFFEVKTLYKREGDAHLLNPENNLTAKKIKDLKKACQSFILDNKKLMDHKRGWRIDLIAISIYEEKFILNHYKNIY